MEKKRLPDMVGSYIDKTYRGFCVEGFGAQSVQSTAQSMVPVNILLLVSE